MNKMDCQLTNLSAMRDKVEHTSTKCTKKLRWLRHSNKRNINE